MYYTPNKQEENWLFSSYRLSEIFCCWFRNFCIPLLYRLNQVYLMSFLFNFSSFCFDQFFPDLQKKGKENKENKTNNCYYFMPTSQLTFFFGLLLPTIISFKNDSSQKKKEKRLTKNEKKKRKFFCSKAKKAVFLFSFFSFETADLELNKKLYAVNG